MFTRLRECCLGNCLLAVMSLVMASVLSFFWLRDRLAALLARPR